MDANTPKKTPSVTTSNGRNDRTDRTTLRSLCGETTHPALSTICCEVDGRKATLSGEAPTFYLKQLAQETAARIDGVDQVCNEISVRLAGQPNAKEQ